MKLHILKIESDYFRGVIEGFKKAELRKNDRGFEADDLIHFVKVDGTEFRVFPNNVFQITHILENVPTLGLSEDYVVLSIERLR